jgi:putative endonuclease
MEQGFTENNIFNKASNRNMRFWVYILTNTARTSLYIGVTNNICRRLMEHQEAADDSSKFAGNYKTEYLLYYEEYQWVNDAFAREKQIKKWSRPKKINLILSKNPNMEILDPPN